MLWLRSGTMERGFWLKPWSGLPRLIQQKYEMHWQRRAILTG
jgi:hypothetical protein